MKKTIHKYVRLVIFYNTRGLSVYINGEIRCVYLINLSLRADGLTIGSSDRYDSFNKLEKTSFTESHMPDV